MGSILKCGMRLQNLKIWVLDCCIISLVKLRVLLPRIPFSTCLEVELAKRWAHVKFTYSLKVFVVSELSSLQAALTLPLAPSPSSYLPTLLMDRAPRSAPTISGWKPSEAMASRPPHKSESPFAGPLQCLRFALLCPPTPVPEWLSDSQIPALLSLPQLSLQL